jgi:hypothetical protein
MSASLSAVPKLQFFDNSGNPLVNGKLYTYAAGTTTPLATYTDSTASTPNTNPIILNSRGEANVWLASTSYKFVLKTSADVEIYTVDNITNAINTSQILAAGGSAANPAYTFASDSDTGMYLAAVGQLGLTVNGVPVMRSTSTAMTIGQSGGSADVNVTLYGDLTQTGDITQSGTYGLTGNFNQSGTYALTGSMTGTGTVRLAAGTAGAPAFSFTGDNDTGVYSVAAGEIGVAVNGTPVLRSTPTAMTIGQTGGSNDVNITLYGDLGISGSAQTPSVAVTFSATAMTVNCSLSNVFTTTFTANVTTAPTLSNPSDGQTINWFITQDATGGRTMTWPASFRWAAGSPTTLTTTANAVDMLVATYRSGPNAWYATLMRNFT